MWCEHRLHSFHSSKCQSPLFYTLKHLCLVKFALMLPKTDNHTFPHRTKTAEPRPPLVHHTQLSTHTEMRHIKQSTSLALLQTCNSETLLAFTSRKQQKTGTEEHSNMKQTETLSVLCPRLIRLHAEHWPLPGSLANLPPERSVNPEV